MSNKETYEYLDERKKLIEKFNDIKKRYPNGGFDRVLKQLKEEIADISEKLYKKDA
jgi:hypothetical protein